MQKLKNHMCNCDVLPAGTHTLVLVLSVSFDLAREMTRDLNPSIELTAGRDARYWSIRVSDVCRSGLDGRCLNLRLSFDGRLCRTSVLYSF